MLELRDARIYPYERAATIFATPYESSGKLRPPPSNKKGIPRDNFTRVAAKAAPWFENALFHPGGNSHVYPIAASPVMKLGIAEI